MRQRRVDIAPMNREDLDAVVAIEHSGRPSPWPRHVFAEELDREWAYLDVARIDDDRGGRMVVAFCNYWLVRDEVHLLNVAVDPDHRRKGIGESMLRHLIDFAHRHACRFVTLEVRRSNTAAQALYRRLGFEPVGVRKSYYAEDREDAIVMTLELH